MLQLARWKIYGILTVVIGALLILAPNLVSKAQLANWPPFLPGQQINLGLDLRGGSYVLFQVDEKSLVAERLSNLQEDLRVKLNEEKIPVSESQIQGETLRLTLTDSSQADQARTIVRKVISGSDVAGRASFFNLAGEGAGLVVTVAQDGKLDVERDAVSHSIEIFRRRLDALGTTEPLIQAQGDDRIIVQLPGVADPESIIHILNQTAKMTFHLVDDTNLMQAIQGRVPPGEALMYEESGRQKTPVLIKKRSSLSGENLQKAYRSVDPSNGNVVSFTLDNEGARKFGDITREYLKKRFAIVLDGKIISAPVIQSPILTGSGQISGGAGGFSAEEADDLATLLSAGALPATFTIADQRTVGAELGADSIHAGIIATIIGSIAVIVFIFMAYGLFGLFANIAVIVNVLLILALVSLLRSTLTLPGIAGIVLTIGMAVDSNVLIYERMKEELKAGKSPINALDAGFSRALATILDANLTTLIAALILFQLGAGPVRGFAVTHAIGTITTIFTAFTMTRLMIAIWARATRPKRLPIDPRPGADGKRPWFRLLPDKVNFRFMRYRHIGAGASIGGAVLSIGLFIGMGLNYSIDFKGGTLVELQTQGPADLAKIRSIANNVGLHGSAQVQQFGRPDDVVIRFESQPGGNDAQQQALAKIKAALKADLGESAKIQRTEVLGPVVAGELVHAGIMALLIAVVCMMVYVWFRFEWQFAIGAALSLFHDIFLTIGIFALFRIEFGLTIIAALLTIVGYSMNDTVVICDRVRENLRKYKKMDLRSLIDLSLNETLSRTVMTAITTLLALSSLYIFGGEVIRNFTFAMIWGVFVGTYSSLYIAAPFILVTGVKRDWSGAGPQKSGVPQGRPAESGAKR